MWYLPAWFTLLNWNRSSSNPDPSNCWAFEYITDTIVIDANIAKILNTLFGFKENLNEFDRFFFIVKKDENRLKPFMKARSESNDYLQMKQLIFIMFCTRHYIFNLHLHGTKEYFFFIFHQKLRCGIKWTSA